MKNKLVLATVLFPAICSFLMCKQHCEPKWGYPAAHLVRFNKTTSYEIKKNGVELNITLDISSDITDDAFLVTYAIKE
jgi:hypothetical protein